MTSDPAAPDVEGTHIEPPRGAGALLQTHVERVDLGEHQGRRLTARVEHRTLRLALGRWWSGSVTVGRRRPTAIEVVPGGAGDDARHAFDASGGAGGRYDVPVPLPVDPWPRFVRRILVLAGAGWLVIRVARRFRGGGGRDDVGV